MADFTGAQRAKAVAELDQLEELAWELARRISHLQETLEPSELPETAASTQARHPNVRVLR